MSRHRNVKRSFSFSSGTLNRLGSCGPVTRSALDGAARLLDLGAGGGRHRDALHDELALHVAHPEQLDWMVRTAHEPRPEQRVRRHLHPVGQQAQVPYVHDLRRLLERIGEAALGNAADERHLAALEPGPRRPAAARRLPLTAPACRLADPRARPAPLADARAVRAQRGLEVVERQLRYGCRLRLGLRPALRRRHRLLPLLLNRHLNEVPDLVEHPAERRVILLDHHVLMVLEPQRLQRAPQEGGMAAARADLADAELPLAHGWQLRVPAGLALAVPARRGLTRHGSSLPAEPCTGSPPPRYPAPSRRGAGS